MVRAGAGVSIDSHDALGWPLKSFVFLGSVIGEMFLYAPERLALGMTVSPKGAEDVVDLTDKFDGNRTHLN